jgi:hypothetical protein
VDIVGAVIGFNIQSPFGYEWQKIIDGRRQKNMVVHHDQRPHYPADWFNTVVCWKS